MTIRGEIKQKTKVKKPGSLATLEPVLKPVSSGLYLPECYNLSFMSAAAPRSHCLIILGSVTEVEKSATPPMLHEA